MLGFIMVEIVRFPVPPAKKRDEVTSQHGDKWRCQSDTSVIDREMTSAERRRKVTSLRMSLGQNGIESGKSKNYTECR